MRIEQGQFPAPPICREAVVIAELLAQFVKLISSPHAVRFAVLAVPTSKNSRRTSWPIQVSAVLRRWTRPNSARSQAKVGERPTRKEPLTNSPLTKHASQGEKAAKQ